MSLIDRAVAAPGYYDDDDPPVRDDSPVLKAKVVSHGKPGSEGFYHTIEVSYVGTDAVPLAHARLKLLYDRLAHDWLAAP